MRNAECGMRNEEEGKWGNGEMGECGVRNADCGMKKGEMGKWGNGKRDRTSNKDNTDCKDTKDNEDRKVKIMLGHPLWVGVGW